MLGQEPQRLSHGPSRHENGATHRRRPSGPWTPPPERAGCPEWAGTQDPASASRRRPSAHVGRTSPLGSDRIPVPPDDTHLPHAATERKSGTPQRRRPHTRPDLPDIPRALPPTEVPPEPPECVRSRPPHDGGDPAVHDDSGIWVVATAVATPMPSMTSEAKTSAILRASRVSRSAVEWSRRGLDRERERGTLATRGLAQSAAPPSAAAVTHSRRLDHHGRSTAEVVATTRSVTGAHRHRRTRSEVAARGGTTIAPVVTSTSSPANRRSATATAARRSSLTHPPLGTSGQPRAR